MSNGTGSSGTLYLILIQVTSRALTFLGNQLLLLFLSPTLLGVAVQLELYSVSVLYFSRESIRVALQRKIPDADATKRSHASKTVQQGAQCQTVINISYVAVTSGLLLTVFFGVLYARTASSEVLSSPYFALALRVYAVATVLELLSEPSFVLVQQLQDYQLRAKVETAAAVYKCLTAVCTAVLLDRLGYEPSALPFATGQLAYSIALLSGYTLSVGKALNAPKRPLFPRKIGAATPSKFYFGLISIPIFNLSLTLYAQSIFKQILTQGDALLLSFLASLADQGVFALASNYGSLLARLVFQPVEESSRNSIGALLSPSMTPTRSNLRQALSHLTTTLHLYFLLTLVCFSLLPTLLQTLIFTLLLNRPGSSSNNNSNNNNSNNNNDRWSNTSATTNAPLPLILAAYAYLLPFLAFNGLLDAFITSVATPSQLRTQSLVAAFCTAVYGGAAWFWLAHRRTGAQGLVFANVVAMAVRVVWAAAWVHSWVGRRMGRLEAWSEEGEEEKEEEEGERKEEVVRKGGRSNPAPANTTNTNTKPAPKQGQSILDTAQWWTASLPSSTSLIAALITWVSTFHHLNTDPGLGSTSTSTSTSPGSPGATNPGLPPSKIQSQITRLACATVFLGSAILFSERVFLWELVEAFMPVVVKRRLGVGVDAGQAMKMDGEGGRGEAKEDEDPVISKKEASKQAGRRHAVHQDGP